MKINILHKKILNLGERGESVFIAIDPIEGETVEQLANRILTETWTGQMSEKEQINLLYDNHIEIRIAKEATK